MPSIADLTVKYGADTSGAEAGASKVNSLIGGVGKGVKGIAGIAVGTALGGGISSVVGAIGGLMGAAPNFDAAMSGVAASLGGVGVAGGITAEQFQALQDEGLRIGQTTSVGATDAAVAMDLLAKAGVSTNDIINGTAQAVVNVSEATGESVNQSASSLGSLSNLFHNTGITGGQMADTIVNAMNSSDATLSEFQTGVANMAPLISNTGMQFGEAAGLISFFNSKGMAAAKVGSSLNSMYMNLINPTTDMTAAQEQMGLQMYDTTGAITGTVGAFVGLPNVLSQVRTATEGMTQADRDAFITQLFGAEALDVVNMALAEQEGALEDHIGSMDKAGSAAEASATRMDNLKGDIEGLSGALETGAYYIGKAFTPALRFMTQGLTKGVNGVINFGKALMDNVKRQGYMFSAWVRTLPGALQPVARLLGGMVPVVGDVADAFQDLVRGDVGGFFRELEEAGRGAFEAIKEFGSTIGQNLQTAFGKVNWGAVWDVGVNALRTVAGGIWDLGVMTVSAAIGWAGDLANMVGRGYDWLKEKLGLPETASFPSVVTAAISTVASWAGDLVGAVGGRFRDWVGGKLGLGTVQGDGTGGPDPGGDLSYTKVVTAMINTVAKWAGDFASAVGGAAGGLANWIKGKLGLGGVPGMPNPFGGSSGGGDMSFSKQVTVAINTIANWLGDLAEIVKGGAGSLQNWVKKKLGLTSGEISLGALSVKASSVSTTLLESGIGQKLKAIAWAQIFDTSISENFGSQLGERFGNWLNGLDWGNLFGQSVNIGTKVGTALLGLFAISGSIYTQLGAGIKGFFGSLFDTINWGGIGDSIKGKLKGAFDTAMEGPTESIQNFSDSIGEKLQGLSDRMGTALTAGGKAFDGIKIAAQMAGTALSSFATAGLEKVGSAWGKVSGALDTAGTTFDTIATAAGNAKALIVDFVTGGIDKLSAIGGDAFSGLTGAIDLVVSGLEKLIDAYNRVAGFLGKGQIGGGDEQSFAGTIGTNVSGVQGTGGGAGSAFGPPDKPAAPTGAGVPDVVPTQPGKALNVPAPNTTNFQKGMGTLKTIAQTATAAVTPTFTQALATLYPAMTAQGTKVNSTWRGPGGLGGLVTGATRATGDSITAFATGIAPLPTAAGGAGVRTVGLFGGGLAPIQGVAGEHGAGADSRFTSGLAPITGNASRNASSAFGGFNTGLSPIVPAAAALGGSTSGQFSARLAPIVPQSTAHGRNASSGFNSGISAVRNAIGIAAGAASGVSGALAGASAGAFGYGAAVGQQFAAGIMSSLGAVSAAAGALRALMPSSPAKKGPLKEPISFKYIVDNLRDNMKDMAPVAAGGVAATARALAHQSDYSNVWARSGASQPGTGGDTYVIITVPTEEWQQVAEDAKAGRFAKNQVSPRGRETTLGMARG